MRFNVAWSEALTQNVVLKVSTLSLSVCVIGLLVTLIKVSLKEPLIIERACYSATIQTVSSERTEIEITAFLKEALRSRFDSEARSEGDFLSPEELIYREQEQREFNEKGFSQRVVFNKIGKIDGTQISVDADRLISVGQIRSAFSFPLTITIDSVGRNDNNPYGLRLIRVKPLESEKKNEK